jgi:hypothetical protein
LAQHWLLLNKYVHLKHKHAAPGQNLRGQHRLLNNRHIDMFRESTDYSRRVTLPEAAEAVVEQTSPEAAQADVE